jgi:hypothetical protein
MPVLGQGTCLDFVVLAVMVSTLDSRSANMVG